MDRILVTGATGFIGSRVVDRLVDRGHQVVALVRDVDRAGRIVPEGAKLAEGDLLSPVRLRAAMQDCDAVVHMAALYEVGVADPEPLRRVNVEGTRNLLSAMEDLGVDRGVYTSSLAVFSDTRGRLRTEEDPVPRGHLSVYDTTKAQAHRLVQQANTRGMRMTTVMPGVAYGPGDAGPTHEVWQRYLAGDLPMVPRRTAYCWTHVDDAAEAHVLALEKGDPGGTYIVAGPPHTLVEALEIAEQITGVPAPRAVHPGWFHLLSWVMRPVAALAGIEGIYHPEALRALAGVTYLGDNAKARDELGYEPRPLAEGLPEALAWEQEQLETG